MADHLIRSRLFWAAYAPLLALLALRFQLIWLRAACGLLAAGGFLTLWLLVVRAPRRTSSDVIQVSHTRDHGPQVSGFVSTYLLPFLTVSQPTPMDVIAYGLFLVIAGFIYVQSDMTEINPTLYLFGRKVAWVRSTGGWEGFVIVRRQPAVGHLLRKVNLSPAVLIEVDATGLEHS